MDSFEEYENAKIAGPPVKSQPLEAPELSDEGVASAQAVRAKEALERQLKLEMQQREALEAEKKRVEVRLREVEEKMSTRELYEAKYPGNTDRKVTENDSQQSVSQIPIGPRPQSEFNPYEKKESTWTWNTMKWLLQLIAIIILFVALLLGGSYIWKNWPEMGGREDIGKSKGPQPVATAFKPKTQAKAQVMGFAPATKEMKSIKEELAKLKASKAATAQKLQVEKKDVFTMKENLATANLTIERLLKEKSEQAQYNEFLSAALDKFFKAPIQPGVSVRRLCFTTDSQKPKCYQIKRPKDWVGNYDPAEDMTVRNRLKIKRL